MTKLRNTITIAGGAFLGALLLTTVVFCAEPSSPAAPEPGVWQKHQYSFAFMGFTTTYSCDGLADKVKVLLLAAGARKDAKSRSGACATPYGRPDKFARADLTFYTLTPRGGDKTMEGEPADGVWRPVAFSRHSPRELARGDCELVEQFASSVLPMFTTRNIENHTTCVPHQDSGSVIDLKFESFTAVAASHPQGRPAPPVKPSGAT
jgi:hypothetical protein